MEFSHKTVLLEESVNALNIREDGIYVDGTLGGGGHSFEIAKRLSPKGLLIGIDRDKEALKAAGERLAPYKDRVKLIHGNHKDLPLLLRQEGIGEVSGILLDLGVSSHQFDAPERGFTYREENAPLDMRMDQSTGMTAADILQTYEESELCRVFREYGEEPFAARIAKKICEYREKKRIETTGELTEIIRSALPAKVLREKGHPSRRVFQALRIECNGEMESLRESLMSFIDLLEDGGRFCVISFHSLEDRMIKRAFREAEDPCTCPKSFPVCVCGKVSKGRQISRKGIVPSAEEEAENRRARSARLRVFERRK